MFNAVLARQGIAPYPGSMAVLDHLDGAGVPSAIVSSSKNARTVLQAAGIEDRFAAVVDGNTLVEQHLAGKPDPAMFLHAAGCLDVAPARGGRRRGRDLRRRRRARRQLRARDRRRPRRQPRGAADAAGADIVVDDLAETLHVKREAARSRSIASASRSTPGGWSRPRLGDDDGGLTGTLFAIGNGYLGLRGDWAPDPQSAGTYVNGFHETFPIVYPETAYALATTGQSMLNAPDAKSIELAVGGEVLRLAPTNPSARRSATSAARSTSAPACRSRVHLAHRRGGGCGSSRNGSSASSAGISRRCDCRSNCSTGPRR